MITVQEYNHTEEEVVGDNASPAEEYLISPELGVTKSKKKQIPLSISSFFRKGGCVSSLNSKFRQFFLDLFMPVGYPDSVESNYLRYQMYDSLQGLCSYLRGVVSTSAVLEAAGVGNVDVTAMSAAMAWALRDGVGMIGGLLFSYFLSPYFDSHVKEFRLLADIMNDVGLTLDMMAPLFHNENILVVSGVATICKVICGMAAGSTKASITAHFALRGNMGDLNAKESTQETLVSLVGMTLGMSLAKILSALESNASMWTWVIFIILTLLHIWANYRGVKLLHLNTLNRQRAEALFESTAMHFSRRIEYLVSNNSNTFPLCSGDEDDVNLILPSPNDVSESLLSSMYNLFFDSSIYLGAKFSHTCKGMSKHDVIWLIKEEFINDRYILGVNMKRGIVSVTLKCSATEADKLVAFLHAFLVAVYLRSSDAKKNKESYLRSGALSERQLIRASHLCVRQLSGERKSSISSPSTISLESLSERGWNCQCLYLGFSKWRITCNLRKED